MTSFQTAILIVSGIVGLIQSGATALLVWVFKRVIAGQLVPSSSLEYVRKDRDERVADAVGAATLWQAAHIKSEEARAVQAAQVYQLLETGRISEALLRSLPHPQDRESQT
jgi:hypothetical protein